MIIDLNSIRSIDALHEDLQKALKFPAFYGNNWDALWDVLVHEKHIPERITFLGYSLFASRFPVEDQAFSKLIQDYNNHCRRKGKAGRIELA